MHFSVYFIAFSEYSEYSEYLIFIQIYESSPPFLACLLHLSKLCELIWLLLEKYCHKFAKYFGQKFKWNKMLLFSKLVLLALLKWGRFPGGLCSITLIQFRTIFNFNIAKCHDEDFGEWRWWWWLWWLQLKHMNESDDDGEDRLSFKTNMKSYKHEWKRQLREIRNICWGASQVEHRRVKWKSIQLLSRVVLRSPICESLQIKPHSVCWVLRKGRP